MPLVASEARLRSGGAFYEYDSDLVGKWGVMPRGGDPARDMRWFDVPGVMGHVMNAYSEGDKVIIDVPLSPGNCFSFFADKHGRLPEMPETVTQITRVIFDLARPDADAVTLHPLAGALGDMPKIDDRFAMQKYRIGYFALRDFPNMGIGQIDWEAGTFTSHNFPGSAAQEPLFVPRTPDAAEGDGYLLTVVDRLAERRTDLVILDGRDISRPPLATIRLPFALPMSFHGSWMSAAEIWGARE
jgi:carotenoid cleavage dioxygenase